MTTLEQSPHGGGGSTIIARQHAGPCPRGKTQPKHTRPGLTCDCGSPAGIGHADPSSQPRIALSWPQKEDGQGLQVEWRPDEGAGALASQETAAAALVCCRECNWFEHGQGDQANALGMCRAQPWDGNKGQWPKAQHRCVGYEPRSSPQQNTPRRCLEGQTMVQGIGGKRCSQKKMKPVKGARANPSGYAQDAGAQGRKTAAHHVAGGTGKPGWGRLLDRA